MRLSIRCKGKRVNDLLFKKGPVYIGRQVGSQVHLPDRGVSRQHAVIYTNKHREWILQDLESANKTYLNNQAIHKCPLNEADLIRISDYTIKVHFTGASESRPETDAQETLLAETMTGDQLVETALTGKLKDEKVRIVRSLDSKTQPIILTGKRVKELSAVCNDLARCKDLKELHACLLEILTGRFTALHVWAAVGKDPDGLADIQGGKMITSEFLHKSQLPARQLLVESMNKRNFLLMPQIWQQQKKSRIRSAMTGPILNGSKCFGLLYADNSLDHSALEPTDLDMLIIISIFTAVKIENIHG